MSTITQSNLSNSTYLSDEKYSDSHSESDCIFQVIFDQHLKVDIETSGGKVFENVNVCPVSSDYIFVSTGEHQDSSREVKNSTLIFRSHISSIHFRGDSEYEMLHKR